MNWKDDYWGVKKPKKVWIVIDFEHNDIDAFSGQLNKADVEMRLSKMTGLSIPEIKEAQSMWLQITKKPIKRESSSVWVVFNWEQNDLDVFPGDLKKSEVTNKVKDLYKNYMESYLSYKINEHDALEIVKVKVDK